MEGIKEKRKRAAVTDLFFENLGLQMSAQVLVGEEGEVLGPLSRDDPFRILVQLVQIHAIGQGTDP